MDYFARAVLRVLVVFVVLRTTFAFAGFAAVVVFFAVVLVLALRAILFP